MFQEVPQGHLTVLITLHKCLMTVQVLNDTTGTEISSKLMIAKKHQC